MQNGDANQKKKVSSDLHQNDEKQTETSASISISKDSVENVSKVHDDPENIKVSDDSRKLSAIFDAATIGDLSNNGSNYFDVTKTNQDNIDNKTSPKQSIISNKMINNAKLINNLVVKSTLDDFKGTSSISLNSQSQMSSATNLASQTNAPLTDSRTQLLVSLFIAGVGLCLVGILLENVQDWPVFKEMNVTLIALPALLGLKGNLQMTLASRLSTHAHMGHVKTWQEFMTILCTNIALNQAQASVISLLASLVAFIMNNVAERKLSFNGSHALLVIANSMLSSSLSSFLLDIIMLAIVFISALFRMNPDNIATPLAASLGDLTTLALYANIGQLFYDLYELKDRTFHLCAWFTLAMFLLILPAWVIISRQSRHTINILSNPYHWYPLLSAMIVGSLGGLVLSRAVNVFPSIALYHPIISGLSGNLAAVQASRLSSYLHRNRAFQEQRRTALEILQSARSRELFTKVSHNHDIGDAMKNTTKNSDSHSLQIKKSSSPNCIVSPLKVAYQEVQKVDAIKSTIDNCPVLSSTTGNELEDAQTAALAHNGCVNPLQMIWGSSKICYSMTRFLLLIAIPGHLFFFLIGSLIASIHINIPFTIMYLILAEFEVFVLIYLAFTITFAAWVRSLDPDNSTIPYLTAIGDLLSASLLTFIYLIGDSFGVQPDQVQVKESVPK